MGRVVLWASSSTMLSGGWAAILGIAVTLILAIAGAAWAVAKAGLADRTISLLQINNSALEERLQEVERDNVEKARIIAKQEERISMLANMVSGTQAVETLAKVINANHLELLEAIRGTHGNQ